jgi:hypothetical protein
VNTQVALQFDGATFYDLELGYFKDDEGITQIPTAATVTIFVENTIIVLGNLVTIGTDGLVSYIWAANDLTAFVDDLPLLNCKAEWSVTVDAVVQERIQYFDLTPVNIRSDVADSDLRQRLPRIDDHRDKVSGRATGGTATTLIDTDKLHNFAMNRFAGSELQITGGGNKNQRRIITSYDRDTATLTLERAYEFAIDAGSSYSINVGWQTMLQAAWKSILLRITEWLGLIDARKILDGNDLSEAHIYLTLAMISESLIVQAEDTWDLLNGKYMKEYSQVMNKVKLKIERGLAADGTIESLNIVTVWSN